MECSDRNTCKCLAKRIKIIARRFHEQCLDSCVASMGEGRGFSEEEKTCLKNCGGKIQNYFKVAKSVGFPVS